MNNSIIGEVEVLCGKPLIEYKNNSIKCILKDNDYVIIHYKKKFNANSSYTIKVKSKSKGYAFFKCNSMCIMFCEKDKLVYRYRTKDDGILEFTIELWDNAEFILKSFVYEDND